MSDTNLEPEEIAGYVTVENHFVTEGTEIEIPHLGTVPNFGTKALDSVQVNNFKDAGFEWPDDNNLVIVTKDPDPEPVVVDVPLEDDDTSEFDGGTF
jgi:hypothetical protein